MATDGLSFPLAPPVTGVSSLEASGSPALTGDIVLANTWPVTLTQTGQQIAIGASRDDTIQDHPVSPTSPRFPVHMGLSGGLNASPVSPGLPTLSNLLATVSSAALAPGSTNTRGCVLFSVVSNTTAARLLTLSFLADRGIDYAVPPFVLLCPTGGGALYGSSYNALGAFIEYYPYNPTISGFDLWVSPNSTLLAGDSYGVGYMVLG